MQRSASHLSRESCVAKQYSKSLGQVAGVVFPRNQTGPIGRH